MCLTIYKKRKENKWSETYDISSLYRFPGLKLRQQEPKQTNNSSVSKRVRSKFRECRHLHFWTENQQWALESGVCACVLSRCSCVRLCYSVDCGGADCLLPHWLYPACVACLKTLCFSFNSKPALKNWKTKSIIPDGILAQLDGIKSDAKILDTILRKEMVISEKQTNKQQQQQNKNQI